MFKRVDTITDTQFASKYMRHIESAPSRIVTSTKLIDGEYVEVTSIPYQTGDFAFIKGGFLSILSNAIFTPSTRLYHTLIIGQYLPDEDDYIIFESLASGVRTGRLSWYSKCTYVVLRLHDPQSEIFGRIAMNECTKFGRWGYDFGMFFLIVKDLMGIWIRQLAVEHRLHQVNATELTYRENRSLICTEFVNLAYKPTQRPPVPVGVLPIPSSILEAWLDHKLILVGSNNIEGE